LGLSARVVSHAEEFFFLPNWIGGWKFQMTSPSDCEFLQDGHGHEGLELERNDLMDMRCSHGIIWWKSYHDEI